MKDWTTSRYRPYSERTIGQIDTTYPSLPFHTTAFIFYEINRPPN